MFKKKPRDIHLAPPHAPPGWIDGDDSPPRGISTKMYSFRGLLRSADLFVVPPYQRAYSWREEEVEKLLADFMKALDEKKESYFLGTSVRQRQADGSYQVIDGQQRMMTLTLLIAYLRDVSTDPAVKAHLQELIAPRGRGRVIVRRADQQLVADCVQRPGRLADLTEAARSPSQKRLAEAAGLIIEAMRDLTQEQVCDVAHFICRRVTFNVVDADPEVSAATLFNVLNQRGLRLPESALVKSQLLVSSGIPQDEAGELSDRWDQLEDALGQDDFEQLLRLTPLLITGGAKKKDADLSLFYAAEFSAKQAADFVRDRIWIYAEIFRLFRGAEIERLDASANTKRLLKLLLTYSEKHWMAPAIDFLMRYPPDAPETEQFLFGLERLCFLRVMGLVQHNAIGPRFIRALAAHGDLKAAFQPNVLGLKEGEGPAAIERFNTPIPTNAGRRRSLAIRANACIDGGEVPLGEYWEATAEHIKPLGDTPYWRTKFPRAGAKEQFNNLLGNLTLLTQPQNDKAANLSFEEKLIIYRDKRYPLRALTRTLEDVGEWNEFELRKRHEMLVFALSEDLRLN